MLPVSRLWFTVSGKIWKIEPSPEQTLSNFLTGWPSRSIHFSYIWFDLRNSKSDFKERLEAVNRFFFILPTLSHCLKNVSEEEVSYLQNPEGTFFKDEPIIFVLFLVPSTLMHKKMFFCKAKNNFESEIDPWRKQWSSTHTGSQESQPTASHIIRICMRIYRKIDKTVEMNKNSY